MAAEEEGSPVDLYVYDLTRGLAALLSPSILGRQVAGVWHTAVVVFGREYFYGSGGITHCEPGGTQLGAPQQVLRLGSTFVPRVVFADYLRGLATTTYTGAAYRLLEHNCNHFSDEVAQFLCDARVPEHIVAQPERDLPPPLRAALAAMLERALPAPDPAQGPAQGLAPNDAAYTNGVRGGREDSPDYLTLNNQIEEARLQSHELEQRRSTLAEKLARTQRRQERRQQRDRRAQPHHTPPDTPQDTPPDTPHHEMAECVELEEAAGPSSRPAGSAPDELEEAEQPARAVRDPPILYRDIDAAAEFAGLTRALEAAGLELTAEERQSLDELRQYLVLGEGSWVLGDDFLNFIGRVLSEGGEGGKAVGAARRAVVRCLAAAALRDDVSLLLHQDRRQHALLAYAHRVDLLPPPEQHALALFMCNLFAHASSSEWLLYISEWEAHGQMLANIRVTTKVCVHCALSEEPELREAGTALLYNVATKEVKTVVFDEVCAELALAALQLLRAEPAAEEEHVWRACSALARLAHHSPDVPQLVAVVGPDPAAYRGTSPRVDEQIDLILQKVK
ncbi:uncharacterized protein LOC106713811 [Papilio machaon]|uniref:uncharacterized protein LOC106713811 n=1 Tax=Papilio machaon TaxID=76193 RepID=UPI001E663FA0|nr:uncharacterized protein LOC106713811 [Papilio machaon]